MSEPLSSHEIEDVLSSIRRLVSEELRPAPRPAAPPRDQAAVAADPVASAVAPAAVPPAAVTPARMAEPGKLLLTPSLRVVGEDWQPAEPQPAAADTAAEALAPETAGPETAGPETARVDPVLLHQGLAARPGAAAAADPLDGPRQGGPLMDYDEDLVWATAGEPDPEPFAPQPRPWAAEPVPHPAWVQSEGDWQEDEPVPFVARPRGAATDDPLALAWADRAEAEVRARLEEVRMPEAEPRAEATDPLALPEGGLFAAGEAVIDEEALRDIVREIIREELAGSLGERITRNVRKLVRIEINRARAAREFD